jgi:uncharacterized membrane protein YkoI
LCFAGNGSQLRKETAMHHYLKMALVTTLAAAGCEGHSNATTTPLAAAATAVASEEKLSLDAVPKPVIDAAMAAVPGLVIEQAERELEKGVVVYDLEGKAGGVRVEVEVTAEGKVLEVERGEDDDDKQGEEDDDDERPSK